jgi:hypothetical protein
MIDIPGCSERTNFKFISVQFFFIHPVEVQSGLRLIDPVYDHRGEIKLTLFILNSSISFKLFILEVQ